MDKQGHTGVSHLKIHSQKAKKGQEYCFFYYRLGVVNEESTNCSYLPLDECELRLTLFKVGNNVRKKHNKVKVTVHNNNN